MSRSSCSYPFSKGYFSTATQELSYRLALSVASFLASAPDQPLALFKEVKDLYGIWSKIVHGDRIESDEEYMLPFSSRKATFHEPRRSSGGAMRTLLEEGLEEFVQTTETTLIEFYQLLVLGFSCRTPLLESAVNTILTKKKRT